MTKRLFWEDPYAKRFEARVLEVRPKGKHYEVRLDQTLFYPTSGGQPHDTGRLGEARVLDVYENEKHGSEILHLTDRPLEVGSVVEGEIDWPRRYRHMQRHTAQHILSQAFLRAGKWNTVAVSLKNPIFTIDFDMTPDEAVVKEAEALANWAVYANLPVRAFFVEEARVPLLPLRRMPKVRGTVRVVEIEDWDLAPCGGTHLRSTAEAGPIKVLGFERFKKHTTRVYATAGWEALEDYRKKHEALKGLALKFASQPLEVPERVEKLERELYETKGRLIEAERALAGLLYESLPGTRVAAQVPSLALAELAKRLSERPETAFLLVAPEGERVRFVLGKHPEAPLDLGGIFEKLRALGAKGGGSGARYQGILPPSKIDAALQTFRAHPVD